MPVMAVKFLVSPVFTFRRYSLWLTAPATTLHENVGVRENVDCTDFVATGAAATSKMAAVLSVPSGSSVNAPLSVDPVPLISVKEKTLPRSFGWAVLSVPKNNSQKILGLRKRIVSDSQITQCGRCRFSSDVHSCEIRAHSSAKYFAISSTGSKTRRKRVRTGRHPGERQDVSPPILE